MLQIIKWIFSFKISRVTAALILFFCAQSFSQMKVFTSGSKQTTLAALPFIKNTDTAGANAPIMLTHRATDSILALNARINSKIAKNADSIAAVMGFALANAATVATNTTNIASNTAAITSNTTAISNRVLYSDSNSKYITPKQIGDSLFLKKSGLTTSAINTLYGYTPANPSTIPAAQVQSDWNAVSGLSFIQNKPTIPTSLPPSGSAGGDLAGTFPNPTITSITGTTAGGNAAAGKVGEYIGSTVASASSITLTSTVGNNVTSISLTAGDWDVQGSIVYATTVASVTGKVSGITTTSTTLPTDGTEVTSGLITTLITGTDGTSIARKRMNLTSTTTVYLVGQCTFSAGTVKAYGALNARRVR